YTYDVRGSNDIRGHGWDTGVWVDGNTGALRQVFLPSGQHSGNTVSTWLWGLHYGDIRDFLPYRIMVALFGLILTMLSITGVYIWWKKRAVQRRAAEQRNWRPGTSAGESELRRAVG
ncbi:MAG TPA: PepSY-associated TM helix domain-containing protein, partial [Dongiaceae bacterium]|nr:PepSY-associated TM helix domain-containing protein [Dongiaceae bacterium]